MPYLHPGLGDSASQQHLAVALKALRDELELRTVFPPEVLAEAEAAVAAYEFPAEDLTGLDFITIDPPGSVDLDQAVHLQRRGAGYRVWYAIADVPGFVRPDGAVDTEARLRGQTVYAPDGRISLHPEVIAEDAASLLPGVVRGAYVWEFDLDSSAAVATASVRRASVRSRTQLTYAEVEEHLRSGGAPENLVLLREIGLKRIELELRRGGASLNLPAQEIGFERGRYFLMTAPALPSEDWNAQISLMTGMEAARIMIEGGIGILRTMPAPDEAALAKFRRQAEACGRAWPEGMAYGGFLRSLDTDRPEQLALMHAAASLFRGAGYTAFDGEVPDAVVQAAIAAPYAHTTAPLRRLVDRFVLVICEALCAGRPVPQWARDALPDLNSLMAAANQASARMESGAMDALAAALLSDDVGKDFTAVVLAGSKPSNGDAGPRSRPSGTVQLIDPAIEAKCYGELTAGSLVTVRLVEADTARRVVRFELAAPAATGGLPVSAAPSG
ncbi:RNB domain-containing ribonuclease [Arthrobacter zhaoguopingii]|uniref:RNB domain-containing ribonuclease n=1 Tax=Arthrobacter zhaoguopingii TaxID=2681491 RepID=UPI00135C5F4F|nr:RNB domain-containing ribonuclease [Arthrobacter zhaoguopingii]